MRRSIQVADRTAMLRALNHSADALDSPGITNDPLTSRSGLRRQRSINQGILYMREPIDRASSRYEISNRRVFVMKFSQQCTHALVKLKSNNLNNIVEFCKTFFISCSFKLFFQFFFSFLRVFFS